MEKKERNGTEREWVEMHRKDITNILVCTDGRYGFQPAYLVDTFDTYI